MNAYMPVKTPPMHSSTSSVNQKLRLLLQDICLNINRHTCQASTHTQKHASVPLGVSSSEAGTHFLWAMPASLALRLALMTFVSSAWSVSSSSCPRCSTTACMACRQTLLAHQGSHRCRRAQATCTLHTCVLRFRPAAKATSSSVSCSCTASAGVLPDGTDLSSSCSYNMRQTCRSLCRCRWPAVLLLGGPSAGMPRCLSC